MPPWFGMSNIIKLKLCQSIDASSDREDSLRASWNLPLPNLRIDIYASLASLVRGEGGGKG